MDATLKKKTYLFPINFNISYIIFKYCGYINFRELVFGKHYEQAGLSASTITYDN